ncbi:hypothetical protein D3C75_604840 [compost metagenome]
MGQHGQPVRLLADADGDADLQPFAQIVPDILRQLKQRLLFFLFLLLQRQDNHKLAGPVLKGNPLQLLADQLLDNIQGRVGQQLLVPLCALPHYLRRVVQRNAEHHIRPLGGNGQFQESNLLPDILWRQLVPDQRHQKLLPQERHALGQLHLQLLFHLPVPFLPVQRLHNLLHYRKQLLAADRLENVIHRMDLQGRLQVIHIIMAADKHDFGSG